MHFPPFVKDPLAKAMAGAHRAVFDATGGRVMGGFFGMTVVKLVTTGRRSGKRRETMLTSPTTTAAGGVVLVGSNGGDDRHPAWYLNLTANPEVELVMRGQRVRAVARTAEADEADQLWPTIKQAFFSYRAYPQMTDREIPVVICDPID